MAGAAVLERTTWLGTYIPLIRVEGQRLDLDGRAQRTGMVQAGQSAQMSIDFYATAEAEAIAAAPKAPYILYAEQISGYERYWNAANDATMPYLLHKAVVVQGQLLPPPRREAVEPPIQAISAAKLMAQQDLQATNGQVEGGLGSQGPERSGAATNAGKGEGEQTAETNKANLAWSIRALGIQCVELIPKLYGTPGDLRQVTPDGQVKTTPVNRPYQDSQGQTQQHLLGQGSYDVVVSTGPSYETARQEVADKLSTMLSAVQPEIQRYFLDTWAGSLDFPGSEDLSARFKTLVPPEALSASEQQDSGTQLVQLQNQLKQATAALQQMQQQMQQSQQTEQVAVQQVKLLEQQVAQMQARLADKAQENQLQAQKQQMDYDIDRQKLMLEAEKLRLDLMHTQAAQMGPHEQNGQEQ